MFQAIKCNYVYVRITSKILLVSSLYFNFNAIILIASKNLRNTFVSINYSQIIVSTIYKIQFEIISCAFY